MKARRPTDQEFNELVDYLLVGTDPRSANTIKKLVLVINDTQKVIDEVKSDLLKLEGLIDPSLTEQCQLLAKVNKLLDFEDSSHDQV